MNKLHIIAILYIRTTPNLDVLWGCILFLNTMHKSELKATTHQQSIIEVEKVFEPHNNAPLGCYMEAFYHMECIGSTQFVMQRIGLCTFHM